MLSGRQRIKQQSWDHDWLCQKVCKCCRDVRKCCIPSFHFSWSFVVFQVVSFHKLYSVSSFQFSWSSECTVPAVVIVGIILMDCLLNKWLIWMNMSHQFYYVLFIFKWFVRPHIKCYMCCNKFFCCDKTNATLTGCMAIWFSGNELFCVAIWYMVTKYFAWQMVLLPHYGLRGNNIFCNKTISWQYRLLPWHCSWQISLLLCYRSLHGPPLSMKMSVASAYIATTVTLRQRPIAMLGNG